MVYTCIICYTIIPRPGWNNVPVNMAKLRKNSTYKHELERCLILARNIKVLIGIKYINQLQTFLKVKNKTKWSHLSLI